MSPMLSSHEGGGAWPGGLCGPLAGIGRNQYLFGDGSYSQNIIQGGSVLQPQARYTASNGITYNNAVVVTGAATVAPDAKTGAAVVVCDSLVIDGGTLNPSTNCKGLIVFAKGGISVIKGGKLHIDKLGKAGNFGNLTVLDLVPASLKRKLKPSLASYVVLGEGAAGGSGGLTGNVSAGTDGSAATSMNTGGGGGGTGGNGATDNWGHGGDGGKGGPCCGGAAGSGGGFNGTSGIHGGNAGDYGGPGGSVPSNEHSNYPCTAGGGDPLGTSVGSLTYAPAPVGAGGGLLMLLSPVASISSGCVVSADGAPAVAPNSGQANSAGGACGGGCVVIITNPGGYTNAGTVRANGGAKAIQNGGYYSGNGGAGSVNTFILTA